MNYHFTIAELPTGERPRERLQHYGAGALSNTELIAILLRTGIKGENVLNLSNRLLLEYGGILGLSRVEFSELAAVRGLGPAKASQLQAALELGRRLMLASPQQRLQITSPTDAANMLMLEMGQLEQEHLRVVLLDTKHYVLSSPTIYKGNVNSAVIRVAEVMRPAVRVNATAMIVAHNHPSGDPTPSPEDVQVTRRIAEAASVFDIKLLDHIVIGNQRFVSLKERGLM